MKAPFDAAENRSGQGHSGSLTRPSATLSQRERGLVRPSCCFRVASPWPRLAEGLSRHRTAPCVGLRYADPTYLGLEP